MATGQEKQANEASGQKLAEAPKDPSLVSLHNGDILNPDTAYELTKRYAIQRVVIAGAPDCGKSTLIASIYERFQRGMFAGFDFAGSNTLMGFERLCFDSRSASGRETPDTKRTPVGSKHLYHLALRSQMSSPEIKHLLLSDLSGEEYREARNSHEECARLTILKGCHHYCILLDGGKLAKSSHRQEARDDCTILLRSFIEAGLVGRSALVDIGFAKWDLVASAPKEARTEEFVAAVREDIRARFSQLVGRIRFSKVIARDPNGTESPASGVEDLLPSWISERPAAKAIPVLSLSKVDPPPREFEQFMSRHFEAQKK